MIDFLRSNRKLLIIGGAFLMLQPFGEVPHLVGKIRWVMGGAVGMSAMDWFDLLMHASPLFLLVLSFLPTKKLKTMQEHIKNGTCTVIDVRTTGEFMGGHVAGSTNIPLQELGQHIQDIKAMQQPIIVCCASGMRSAQAAGLLQKAAIECYNGGSWMTVNGM